MTRLKILSVCAVLSLGFTNCSGQSKSTQSLDHEVVTEVAAYRIESAKHENFNSKRRRMEHAISSFDEYGSQLDNIPAQELTKEEKISYQEMIEDAKLGCMTGMLICLERKQRLVYLLGEIFEIESRTGANLLEMSAANFRQVLSRARKDLYHFMHDKCGLLNKNNPCRCPKKTKGFIAAGWVNKNDLQFNNHFLQRIEEIAKNKVNEYNC